MCQQAIETKQANLQIIKKIMDINQIKLEELIEFIDLNKEVIQNKQIKVEKPNKLKTLFTKVSSKWGDDAVGLEEEGVVPIEEELTIFDKSVEENSSEELEDDDIEVDESIKMSSETDNSNDEESPIDSSLWKNVVKKHIPNTTKSQLILNKVNTISKKLQIVTSLSEFVESIKQKKKLYVDFLIDDDAHCEHTFNGTLCPNVKRCGKIHLQRCMNNLNCSHKNCPYLHINDMYNETAKNNFMDTMDVYNDIKKNKKVYT